MAKPITHSNDSADGDAEAKEKNEEDEIPNKASLLCSDSTLRTNLICLILLWMTVAFAYYLIAFELKYLSGNIYINACVTTVAEIIGKLASGVLIFKIGLRPVYLGSFSTAAVGTLFLILFPDAAEIYISIFLLITRFGASMAIVAVSVGTVIIMPT